MKQTLLVLILLVTLAPAAFAHEVRPSYLELRQTGPETYDRLWKVPGKGDLRLGLYVELPTNCTNVSEPHGETADSAYTERWTVKCLGGLTGGTIHVAGLSGTVTDVLVRLERLNGTTDVRRLTPDSPSFVVEATASVAQVAKSYLALGIEHILTGWDHLLYILGMLLLVRGWRRVMLTMSAFTLTHSLTLTGAALGFVHVPPAPVEACIALSILFVAGESARREQNYDTLARRWPWAIAFTFGLLHGFGFAGALTAVGLPQHAIPVALLLFNLGVEVGQLMFICGVFAVFVLVRYVLKQSRFSIPEWSWRVPAYSIGGVAAFWFIQRVVAY